MLSHYQIKDNILLSQVYEVKVEVKMEVNSLRSWLRDYNRAFVLKHQRSYKRTIQYGRLASKAIVQPTCWLNSLCVAHLPRLQSRLGAKASKNFLFNFIL